MIRDMDVGAAELLLAAATEARKALRGPEGEATKARLEALYPDLRSAFDVFLADGRTDQACELGIALVPFWLATRRISEGDSWLAQATSAIGASDRTRARALYEHGYLIFWAGEYDRSARLSRAAIALARSVHDSTVIALSLAVLGRIALNSDVEEAKRLLREAISVTEGTDDREGRSSAMHVLGVAYQMSGELDAASDVMRARIAIGREMDNETLVAVESANLSMVERQLGNLEQARALSLDALAIVSRRGEELMIPWVVNGLAAVTAALGDLEHAAVLNGFAEAGIERAGGKWPPDEREQYEWTLATLRAGMPIDALDRARAQGRVLSTAAGVELALSARPTGAPAT
jgi:tetratricopeptide (TPR) repeat protein